MRTPLITFLVGLALGVLAGGLVLYGKAADVMLIEDTSRLDHAETVRAIREAALDAGWKVPAVHDLHESVAKGGYEVRPATVIELCSVPLAGGILDDDDSRRVAPMMPCRVAVYETAGGEVIVSRMNSALLSRAFGGTVEETMSEAAAANEEIFATVLAD